MINNVVLVGRITKDLELRQTGNGVPVCQFTLAVNRAYKTEHGQSEADFIQCIAWRQSAENLCKYMGKGSLIGVQGSIQTRSYDNNQNQKVYVTEIQCSSIQFLESKKDNQWQGFNQNQGFNQPQGNPYAYNPNNQPNQNQNYNQNFNQNAQQNNQNNNPFITNIPDFDNL